MPLPLLALAPLALKGFDLLMDHFQKKKEEGRDSKIVNPPSMLQAAFQKKLNETDLETAQSWLAKAQAAGMDVNLDKFDALRAKAEKAKDKLQELSGKLSPSQIRQFSKIIDNVSKNASTKYPNASAVLRKATADAIKKRRAARQKALQND